MSIDISLDRDKHEIEATRQAIAGALLTCAGFAPELAAKASDLVLQALFDQFAGGRVYFPLRRGKSDPDAMALVEAQLRAGSSCREIAKDLKVSKSYVGRIRKRLADSPTLAVGLSEEP